MESALIGFARRERISTVQAADVLAGRRIEAVRKVNALAPYGNINTSVIGPADRPRVRLPGSGGTCDNERRREGGALIRFDAWGQLERRSVHGVGLARAARPGRIRVRANAP